MPAMDDTANVEHADEAARAAYYQAHKNDPAVWGEAEERDPPRRPLPELPCDICKGVLERHAGSVIHLLLRLVTEPNPHEGWWRDHPDGPRFICDACYAAHIHPVFANGAPEYVPKDRAVLPHDRAPKEEET